MASSPVPLPVSSLSDITLILNPGPVMNAILYYSGAILYQKMDLKAVPVMNQAVSSTCQNSKVEIAKTSQHQGLSISPMHML